MNKIRLFIEEQEIELQEEVQVSITRQLEELTNPTVICNDYTKTVKIPMTSQNNQIFGNIYNPDRITVDQPDNLLLNMRNGVELTMSGNFFHTNKEYPIQYGHPEFLYPETLYNQYWPSEVSMSSISGYTVYRGVPSAPYDEFIPETTDLGRKGFTFTLSSSNTGTQRYLTLRVNGTPSTQGGLVPYVVFDLTDFENGTYSFSFETVKFDTTLKEVDIKNVVLAKSDKIVWMEDVINPLGIHFNPMRKLNFRLEWNGGILMQGYTKLLSAKQENGKGFYEVTLNGEIGKIFQELKKITFDTTVSADTENSKYYIDGSQYVSSYINRDLVYSAWTSGQTVSDIQNPNCEIKDIIGFAPCNAFDDEFEYDTIQYFDVDAGRDIGLKFSDYLNEYDFSGYTGIDASSVIPDGMTPRGVGEYRSYLQQPYIYFNKLFQIFKIKGEQLTGYKFDLDDDWFKNSNPYWYNTVIMLKKFNNKRGEEKPNSYSGKTSTSEFVWSKNTGGIPYSTTQISTIQLGATDEQMPRLEDNKIKIETYDNDYISACWFDFYLTGEMNHGYDILFTVDNMFLMYLNFVGQNGHAVSKAVGVYRDDSSNIDVNVAVASLTANGDYLYPISNANKYGTYQGGISSSSQYGWHITVLGNNICSFDKHTWGDYVTVSLSTKWLNNHTVFGAAQGSSTSEHCYLSNVKIGFTLNVQQNVFNSNSYFTLNDIWNNDYNLFDIILNYCKMHRIFVKADPLQKKLKFMRSDTYFKNNGTPIIEDWTDKICMDKDYTIKPITWEHKYVLFNYEDSENKLGEEYRDKYGADWGEKRIVTDYTFNTETDELFSGITPSLINTNNVLSWYTLRDEHKVAYSFPSETSVYMADKDGKYVPQFGAMYFDRGRVEFDTSTTLHMTNVFISDDTDLQRNNNTYFYSGNNNAKWSKTYPNLDVVYSNYMCTFGKPMENYTYQTTAYNNKTTIYDMVWKKYVEERYNKNNKVLTCYIHLTPYDYINFDFNHFIKIENQLYVVNKIYDYDAVTNQKVKVDLITVQDITGYTSR